MSYKTLASMNIAVIGNEEIADVYAFGFAFADHKVFRACRQGEELACISYSLHNITVCSIEEAAEVADIIVVATAPRHVREVAYWLGDVRSKIIIDVTSNVFAAEEDLVKTVCGIQSITGSKNIVKVFNTAGYDEVLAPLYRSRKINLVMVGDSVKAKEVTKILANDLEMTEFYDFGGTEAIPLFNEMTRAWRNVAVQKGICKELVPAAKQ